MIRRLFLLTVLALPIGCAGLKIQQSDSFGTKIAKGVARVPIAILTVGQSERYYTMERTMASWLGQPANDLVFVWGPPNNMLNDGNGKVLVYTQNRSLVHPGNAESTTTGS